MHYFVIKLKFKKIKILACINNIFICDVARFYNQTLHRLWFKPHLDPQTKLGSSPDVYSTLSANRVKTL